jgi:tetratricopeptide (TPR) repeat protein
MERRKHPRIPQRLYLRIEELGNKNIAFTSDVSLEGIFIETSARLEPGSHVRIQLTLPNGKATKLFAQVRWASQHATTSRARLNNHGIGLLLQKIPDDFEQFISAIVSAKADGTRPEVMVTSVDEPAKDESERSSGKEVDPIVARIGKAYHALATQNHYEVLGVVQEAQPDKIKQAYYQMSKDYHPDRYIDVTSEELKKQLETLFQRIAESYAVLSSVEQRRAYDFELVERKVRRPRRTEAKPTGSDSRAQQGRWALKNGNPETAAVYFELAVQANPEKGKYYTLLAYALSKIPRREKEAEENYKKAMELEPSRIDNYVGLGRLYKQAGLTKQALQVFEEALAWDAEHPKILREIDQLKAQERQTAEL